MPRPLPDQPGGQSCLPSESTIVIAFTGQDLAESIIWAISVEFGSTIITFPSASSRANVPGEIETQEAAEMQVVRSTFIVVPDASCFPSVFTSAIWVQSIRNGETEYSGRLTDEVHPVYDGSVELLSAVEERYKKEEL